MKLYPFLTGSRAYGIPTADSDWDIVFRCTSEEKAHWESLGQHRIGPVNFIFVTSNEEWWAWREATNNLISKAPVTRQDAIEEIDRRLAAHNVLREEVYCL